MDAVVAFIATGEATKPVEPGERALGDPAEHAKAAAMGRAATAEDGRGVVRGTCVVIGTGSHATLPDIPGLVASEPLTQIETLELDHVRNHLLVLELVTLAWNSRRPCDDSGAALR